MPSFYATTLSPISAVEPSTSPPAQHQPWVPPRGAGNAAGRRVGGIINFLLSPSAIISHASCTCIPFASTSSFLPMPSAFVVISSLSYALPRPLFPLRLPLCASAGLTSFLRSGLLFVLAGAAAAMPIDPSLLAVRSHGTLTFHLYIHCTLPPLQPDLHYAYFCLCLTTVFTHLTTAHHASCLASSLRRTSAASPFH